MTKDHITIDGRKIGRAHSPYVIAELSANHNGDINRAYKIIESAKISGADAIKIQSYTADTITMKSNRPEFQIHGGLWDGKSLYELYEWAHLPWGWHKPLFDYARKLGITMFSSPFDFTAVDLLEDLNAPAYKIASFEAVDIPLIRYVARTGKPMIISTGMASRTEIEVAVDAARSAGCNELVVLHCVSGYPAPAQEYNLKTLQDIGHVNDVIPGLSDHTIDNTTAISAVALGACVIEKHVTLDRNGGGPDDSFSLEPIELEALCRQTKIAWQATGEVSYEKKASELPNIQFRRSLYVAKPVRKGESFSSENVRSIRPGNGLAPSEYDAILGRKAKVDIDPVTPLSWDLIDSEDV